MAKHFHLALACMICGLLFVPMSGSAASSTLDQSQQSGNGNYIFTDEGPVAQTFTAGITGQLTQVDVWLGAYGEGSENITLRVVETIASAPTGAVLGSLTQTDPPNGWCTFDLSPAGAMLQQGTQYAIVLSSDDPNGGADPSRYVNVRWGNVYPGGALWDQYPTGTWGPTTLNDGVTPGDMAFRTWMVPEPPVLSAVLPLMLSLLRRTIRI